MKKSTDTQSQLKKRNPDWVTSQAVLSKRLSESVKKISPRTIARYLNEYKSLPEECRPRQNGHYHVPSWENFLKSRGSAVEGILSDSIEIPDGDEIPDGMTASQYDKLMGALIKKEKLKQIRENYVHMDQVAEFVNRKFLPIRNQIDNLPEGVALDLIAIVGNDKAKEAKEFMKGLANKMRLSIREG